MIIHNVTRITTEFILVDEDGVAGTILAFAAINPEEAEYTDASIQTVDTNVDSVLVDTGTTIPNQITALNNVSTAEVNAEMVDVLRTDTLPDSYSADAAQPTIAQAILEIRQWLMERVVSSTTVSVKKPDGSTEVMTFTLNDATNPTSITRAS